MFTHATNNVFAAFNKALNIYSHARIAAFTAVATLAVAAVSFIPATAAVDKNVKMFAPKQAFSQTLGSKQTMGYFEEKDGRCFVTLMVAESFDENSDREPVSAARIRMSLEPMHSTQIESAESRGIVVTCGANAKSVSVSAAPEAVM